MHTSSTFSDRRSFTSVSGPVGMIVRQISGMSSTLERWQECGCSKFTALQTPRFPERTAWPVVFQQPGDPLQKTAEQPKDGRAWKAKLREAGRAAAKDRVDKFM